MRITGIVVALILVVLGFSWVLGGQAEKGLEIYASNMSSYSVELNRFDRGLTHSVAYMTIKPDLEQILSGMDGEELDLFTGMLGGLDDGVSYIVDIYQGPLVFRNGFFPGLYKAEIRLDPESELVRRNIPGDVDINDYIKAEYRMGYAGSGELVVDINAFSRSFRDTTFAFGGFSSLSKLENFGNSYSSSASLGPMSLSSPDQSLEISGIEVEGKGSLSGLIADTDISMNIPLITGNGDNIVSINDLGVIIRVDAQEDAGTFSAEYGVATGRISSSTLPAPVNHIKMTAGGRNMSIAGVQTFYEAVQAASSSADPIAAQMAITNNLGALLEGNPVFEISEFSFSQGTDTTLDMDASMSFSENIFANPAVMQTNPMMALTALNADINMLFSQSLVDMVLETYVNNQFDGIEGMDPQFLDQMRLQQLAQMKAMPAQMMQAGYLLQEGNAYKLRASVQSGQLLINGNPLPLPF